MTKSDKALFCASDLIVAGVLLSRLPLPHAPKPAFQRQSNAVWAFPLVGLVLGIIAALTAQISMTLGLPAGITALIVLAVSMFSTGAMHEDGLADTFDGLWGGWDPARRLEIMKDSHIGTYGVLALIIATGIRWSAYAALLPSGTAALIAAAVLSRSTLPLVMWALPHARSTGLAHSVGRPPKATGWIALGLGILIAVATTNLAACPASMAACLVTFGIALIAKRKVGGQTGDILGAIQQLSEIAVLLVFVALL